MSKKKAKNDDSPVFSIDDFTEIQPMAQGWELQPGKFYLIVSPKQFSRERLNALFDKMRDAGVEFGVHIGETPDARIISVRTKDESSASATTAEVAPGPAEHADRSEGGPQSVETESTPVQRPLGY